MPRCQGKGQQFERDICRDLSLWVSRGKSKNLFWRSSQSGGRATTLRRKGENLSVHAGDICAIDKRGEQFIKYFFVETKFYHCLDLDMLCYAHLTGRLKPMWRKCCQQAAHYQKVPLLIFKENFRPPMLVAPFLLIVSYLRKISFTDLDATLLTWSSFREDWCAAGIIVQGKQLVENYIAHGQRFGPHQRERVRV
jgi:hypothetical protein